MDPIRDLMAEHEVILKMLQIHESISRSVSKGTPAPVAHLRRILEFYTIFVDACHHGKEEAVLFPAVRSTGLSEEEDIIELLLAEHRTARTLVRMMSTALKELKSNPASPSTALTDPAGEFLVLMLHHIGQENRIFFPVAERKLDPRQRQEITEAFRRIEENKIGPGRHEAFHLLMDELAHTYLKKTRRVARRG